MGSSHAMQHPCIGHLCHIARERASTASKGCITAWLQLLHLLLCLCCLDGLTAPVVTAKVWRSSNHWQQLINQLQEQAWVICDHLVEMQANCGNKQFQTGR